MFAAAVGMMGLVVFGIYGLYLAPKTELTMHKVTSERVVNDLLSIKSSASLFFSANPTYSGDISSSALSVYYPRGFNGSTSFVATISGGQLYVYSVAVASTNNLTTLSSKLNCSEMSGVKSTSGVLTTSCISSSANSAALPSAIPQGALVVIGGI